jgi:hypothetical protein
MKSIKPGKTSKKEMATVADVEGILDEIGAAKGAARDKAKQYCIGLLQDKEGQCLPANDVRNMATSFYDGYLEAMRMR